MHPVKEEIFSLVESGVFSHVDVAFAKMLFRQASLPEESSSLFLLSYLLAMARQGHLCVHVKEKEIIPNPSLLTSNELEIACLEKKIRDSFFSLPSAFCQTLFSDTKPPVIKPLCRYKNALYLQKNWTLETKFLFHIQRLISAKLHLKVQEENCLISPLLNEEQRRAVFKALNSPVSLISGGPGTGKSFTAIEMIKTFLSGLTEEERETVIIQVAAPTGKAAAHLQRGLVEHLGSFYNRITCKTLHSLLKVRSSNLEKQGLMVFADLLLIDEASMLDAQLFIRLLSHLRAGGRLILMGDKEQLPPVESGGFFADLIDLSSQIGVSSTILKQCLRVERQELKDLADAVQQENVEAVSRSPFVQTFSVSRVKEMRDLIWAYSKPFFSHSISSSFDPKQMFLSMEQFRILSCMRKGFLGVESLNEMILSRCLEEVADFSFLAVPILIKVNDSATDLVNGDTGLLVARASSLRRKFLTSEDTAYFLSKEEGGELRSLAGSVLPSFEFGYCLSVHKSQGSEYSRVLVLAPQGSEVFGKEVVYTAITRAKKELLFLVEETILTSLLQKSSRKKSGLSYRLELTV